jgi:hypothetical protein
MLFTFDELLKIMPIEVRAKLDENLTLRENPKFHPEENAFEHIKIVTNRLTKTKDINLILAGLFHDICKKESAIPREKSPWFLCRDHEKKGADFAMEHKNFILSLGGNPKKIHWIIWNHMRIKIFDEMRKKKQKELTSNKWFNDLLTFSKADKMFFDWDSEPEPLRIKKELDNLISLDLICYQKNYNRN